MTDWYKLQKPYRKLSVFEIYRKLLAIKHRQLNSSSFKPNKDMELVQALEILLLEKSNSLEEFEGIINNETST